MNKAVAAMLEQYPRRSVDDHVNALREIFQNIALCGLWRGKFHEKGAFYGGTALRILHGLDRYSEDMDFSLMEPDPVFDLAPYCSFIEEELGAWGFATSVTAKSKTVDSAIESAFLKANTREQFLVIEADPEIVESIHGTRRLKIKFEVDTDPPPGFRTETRFLLQPIPFSVRIYDPPSLFAGKMHALLCRSWKNRVKGRDWYDFVWYVGRGTELDLGHLGTRMRQSGHYDEEADLDEASFRRLLADKISGLDVADARSDVERFIRERSTLEVWSQEFFSAVAERVVIL
ncbi:MAG: nucleotidyl transferase AbiEii/AbiGii toxin family protein [Acidobacteria bacterium]|uniref:Nucleotidyl transferase AbiEii/AbiGii toxin family protein n=1 Tax=Candidatus Polarisedimenticola svalbardensis TaxID=2886004 RepID=A0A8J6XZ21_9BACT|nr:nucleotidyl transferase AbiEii/AbiGii toxin family protein [Candidatus Polarisedimenticola svalbardensis]